MSILAEKHRIGQGAVTGKQHTLVQAFWDIYRSVVAAYRELKRNREARAADILPSFNRPSRRD